MLFVGSLALFGGADGKEKTTYENKRIRKAYTKNDR